MDLGKILKEKAKILIIGLGYRTGLHTANFLSGRGFEVAVSDTKKHDQLLDVLPKLDQRVKLYAGDQSPSILNDCYDLIILSPGVPATIPLVKEAKNKCIPVIAEVELSFHYMKGMWVAITGTDGKSTTTSLINHVLKSLGFKSREGGNIGIPLISLVDSSDEETVTVAELSSFQLETVENFRPDVSLLLNVTPDHLDRYDSMQSYFEAKLRIAMNQKENDFMVCNKDDFMIACEMDGVRPVKKTFSLTDNSSDAYYDGDIIFLKVDGVHKKAMSGKDLSIIGIHNVQNTMAALLAVQALSEKIGRSFDLHAAAKACATFKGLPHRMEVLGEYQGRTFINDSKATTIGAVEMALKSVSSNSVYIIGGRGKGDDYNRLSISMKDRVKSLILLGETKNDFLILFSDYDCFLADDMQDAVKKALKASVPGDTIILSPACASFDMYKSFEHRGDHFREIYQKLKIGELSWT